MEKLILFLLGIIGIGDVITEEIEVSMDEAKWGIYILTNEETLCPSLICRHFQGYLLICLFECFKVFILVSEIKEEKQIAGSRTFTTFSQ